MKASEMAGTDWTLHHVPGQAWARDQIQIILLQEIRDQLVQLNTLMHCANTLKIPRELSGLRRDVKALTKALLEKSGTPR